MSREGIKQSVYLGDLADEIERESIRLDRTTNWLMRRAWNLARERIRQMPSAHSSDAGAAP